MYGSGNDAPGIGDGDVDVQIGVGVRRHRDSRLPEPSLDIGLQRGADETALLGDGRQVFDHHADGGQTREAHPLGV